MHNHAALCRKIIWAYYSKFSISVRLFVTRAGMCVSWSSDGDHEWSSWHYLLFQNIFNLPFPPPFTGAQGSLCESSRETASSPTFSGNLVHKLHVSMVGLCPGRVGPVCKRGLTLPLSPPGIVLVLPTSLNPSAFCLLLLLSFPPLFSHFPGSFSSPGSLGPSLPPAEPVCPLLLHWRRTLACSSP